MKSCPRCSRTYASIVDFCFEDGEVLEDAGAGTEGVPPTLVPPSERLREPPSSLSASGEVLMVPTRDVVPESPRDGAAVDIATPLPPPERHSHDGPLEADADLSVWRMVRNTAVLGAFLGGTVVMMLVVWGGTMLMGDGEGDLLRLPWMSAPELRDPHPVEQDAVFRPPAPAPQRERPPGATQTPAPRHPPASGVSSEPPGAPEKPRSGPVRFVLSNIDGARLRIDNQQLPNGGLLPLEGVVLTEGAHRFTVVLPDGLEFQIQRNVVLSDRGVTEIRLDAD